MLCRPSAWSLHNSAQQGQSSENLLELPYDPDRHATLLKIRTPAAPQSPAKRQQLLTLAAHRCMLMLLCSCCCQPMQVSMLDMRHAPALQWEARLRNLHAARTPLQPWSSLAALSSQGLGFRDQRPTCTPSPMAARLGLRTNWFSASSLWYTQDTSGDFSRSPTKAKVLELRTHWLTCARGLMSRQQHAGEPHC